MKAQFIFVKSKKSSWSQLAQEDYVKKIQNFCSVEITEVKAIKEEGESRKILEGEKILKSIRKGYSLITFDERGKTFSSSKDFSNFLIKSFSENQGRLCFVVGGAYGLSEEVRKQSSFVVSLSHFTLGHQVAFVTVLEQIYRGFTIWKNLPYHK